MHRYVYIAVYIEFFVKEFNELFEIIIIIDYIAIFILNIHMHTQNNMGKNNKCELYDVLQETNLLTIEMITLLKTTIFEYYVL